MSEQAFAPEYLVARFDDPRRLVSAVRAVRARGLRVYDVYTPHPVHHLDEAMGLTRSRLPLATLAGGVLGLVSALALELYVSVYDWPLNVGGKPDNSLLAFIRRRGGGDRRSVRAGAPVAAHRVRSPGRAPVV